MTVTLDEMAKAKREVSAEQAAATELVRLAKEQGLSLTGPDGLLKQLTRSVIQTALGAVPNEQEHAGGSARRPWEQGILDAAGDELGRKVIASEGCPQLQNRLSHLRASGVDVRERLRNAITERELDTAVDKAITLVWRLKTNAHTAQTKPAKPTTKGSPPPVKRTKSENDPKQFARKQIATEH